MLDQVESKRLVMKNWQHGPRAASGSASLRLWKGLHLPSSGLKTLKIVYKFKSRLISSCFYSSPPHHHFNLKDDPNNMVFRRASSRCSHYSLAMWASLPPQKGPISCTIKTTGNTRRLQFWLRVLPLLPFVLTETICQPPNSLYLRDFT